MATNIEHTIIGIDGGGTHTRGILYREGKIIAESKVGTTRIGAVGVGESCERLLNVIEDLCKQASLPPEELDAVVIGLAGAWLEEEKKRSAHLIRTLARGQDIQFNDLMVTSDAELAFEGAFGTGSGIMLIVGTGSIALGRNSKGKVVRCGGWGIELDDEGSGAWIGREGLTAIVRAIDGRGKKTKLTEIFGNLYPTIDINEPRTIVKAYAERTFEYHMLTPMIMKCATEGDEVAVGIIDHAAFHLMELFDALMPNFSNKPVQVTLMGGIIDAKTMLAKKLDDAIKKNKNLKLVKSKGTALDGAIAIGKRLIEEMD
jgi:N-acetylglucosamine kinase-like BadF-type ATPase